MLGDKVAGLLFKISADTKVLEQGMKQMNAKVGALQQGMKALGAAIIAAFSVRAVAGFAQEIIKLAGEAQGVREAFGRLDNAPKLLRDMEIATRNTVSELELMKYAVQAKNFKIPLQQLATYFEFATKRAAQTGESVDYLVQSLITGIGRKSVLVMDNLGISAVELQEEVKKIGDFGEAAGNIIRRELGSMGEVTKTAAQETQTLGKEWKDFKTYLGEAVSETVNLTESLSSLNAILSELNNPKSVGAFVEGLQMVAQTLWYMINPLLLANKLLNKFKKESGEIQKQTPATGLKNKPLPSITPVATYGIANLAPEFILPQSLSAIESFGLGLTDIQEVNKLTDALRLFRTEGVEGLAKAFPKLAEESTASIDRINQSMETLKTGIADVGEETRQVTVDMMSWAEVLSDVLKDAVMALADALGAFVETLTAGGGFKNALNAVLVQLGGFMQQIGALFIAYGLAQTAFFQSWAAGPAGAATLIAAGAVLVGLGAAISGLAKKGMTSGQASAGYSTSGSYATGGLQPQTVQIEGVLRGSDIYWSNARYSNLYNELT